MKGLVEEAAEGVVSLVGEDLSEGETGTVVDGDMDVLVACAASLVAAVASDPVAGVDDASELFDLDVEQLARELALVTHDGLGRFKGRETGEAVTCQDARDGGLGE